MQDLELGNGENSYSESKTISFQFFKIVVCFTIGFLIIIPQILIDIDLELLLCAIFFLVLFFLIVFCPYFDFQERKIKFY